MKILHIISSSGFYGAEGVLLNLVSMLKKDGHQPHLVCLKNKNRPDPQIHLRAKQDGISSQVICCRRKLDFAAIKEIREFICRENIQLVHTHGYKSDFYGLIAAKLAKVPIIATLHLWTQESAKDKLYEWLDKFTIERMDHLVCVSPVIAEQLKSLGIAENKTSLIPNGIDTDKFNSKEVKADLRDGLNLDGNLVIGTVGRLVRQKGQAYLLEAFKELAKNKDFKLLIVGDGHLKMSLKKQVKKMGIEGEVIFAGAQKDVAAAYNTINIFVLPSIDEGLPLALLEAMSMGLAVIATKVGAVTDVINSQEEGLLVSPGNSEELKQAISVLIKDSKMRKQMGKKAREKVISSFSLQSCYQKYLEIYKKFS